MKTTLLALCAFAFLAAIGLFLKEKQVSLALGSQMSEQKLELIALSEHLDQLELEKESSLQIIEKLRAQQQSLQVKLDLQAAELTVAREALHSESDLLQKANAQLSTTKANLSTLNTTLLETERKLKASSQSGKIAQLQERIQDLEATNVQLVAQLQTKSEQSSQTSTPNTVIP